MLGVFGCVVSIGLGWAEPVVSEADDEIVVEASYRVQLTPTVSLMPDVQYIQDPAGNPDVDETWIGSVRMGITL